MVFDALFQSAGTVHVVDAVPIRKRTVFPAKSAEALSAGGGNGGFSHTRGHPEKIQTKIKRKIPDV
jgi:hypothetical protein